MNPDNHTIVDWNPKSAGILISILLLSIVLNVCGNRWGSPAYWHPDELIHRADYMVQKRTLNPHTYPYGGLQYSILALGAVVPSKIYSRLFDPRPDPSDDQNYLSWMDRDNTRKIVMSRTISAIFGTSLVFVTFLMGSILFNYRTGLLAASFLAVSPHFVGLSHFATVDMPANFWFWLSCLFSLLVWKHGHRAWYALSALTAGFAIGTKIDRAVIVLPLLMSHFASASSSIYRNIALYGLLIPVAYVIANPALIISFFEFLDGTTRDLFFNMLRGEVGETSYIKLLHDIKSGMGMPLFICAIGGLCYGAYNLLLNKDRFQIIWLASILLPYYFIFSSRLSATWYAPFFFPGLTLLAAYVFDTALRRVGWQRAAATITVFTVIIFSFLSTLAIVLQFTNDSRNIAAGWIVNNIPVNATLELPRNGPIISHTQYHVVAPQKELKAYSTFRMWRDKLNQHEGYRKLHAAILFMESWMSQNIGWPDPHQPYAAWFDKIPDVYDGKKVPEVPTIDNGSEASIVKSDYKVLMFFDDNIEIPDSEYVKIEKIFYENPFGIDVRLPFVNPTIYIYRHQSIRG
jgi:hypothetical protein